MRRCDTARSACLSVWEGLSVTQFTLVFSLFFFLSSLRDNVKNRLDGNALDEATAVTPGGAKKKAKSCLIHSSCLTRAVAAALKQGNNNNNNKIKTSKNALQY